MQEILLPALAALAAGDGRRKLLLDRDEVDEAMRDLATRARVILTVEAYPTPLHKRVAEGTKRGFEEATKVTTDAVMGATKATTDAVKEATKVTTDAVQNATKATTDAVQNATKATTDAVQNATKATTDAFHTASTSVTHSFAATNWQTLVPRRRGPGMNGWFSATQYACAGAAAMIAGDLAYRDDRPGDGFSGLALTSTPFVASGALAVASFAAGWRDLAAMLALLAFNCVFEATSCVCAANIGRHARAAAEEEEEEEEGAEEEEEEEEVGAENEEESAESYARLGSSREEEARIDSGLDRPRLDAFGGRVTTLFVMISAAGYLVEAVLIRLCGWAGRGGLGSRDRFLVHAAWLAVVGCGLVALHLRSNRRPDEGDYVALEDGDV